MIENIVMDKKGDDCKKLTKMEQKVFHRYQSAGDAITEKNWIAAEYQVSKFAERKYMANSPFSSASERDRVNSTLYNIVEKKIDTTVSFYINKKGFAESDF